MFDISDPTSPVMRGAFTTPGITGFMSTADHVYAAGGGALHVFDVSGESPEYVGNLDFDGSATGVAAGEEYVYVTVRDGDNDILILPKICGPVPVELSFFAVSSTGGVVSIVWETGFEVNHVGFYVDRAPVRDGAFVRVSNNLIHDPSLRRSHYAFIDETVVTGESYRYRLVAVDAAGGEQRFALGAVAVGRVAPGRLVLHQNRPNPFNPATAIVFELPAAAHVRLRIYDVTGAMVRGLVDGRLARDIHRFEWDGRDERGREVGAGVYYYRLEAGVGSVSRKMVLVK